MGLFKHILVPTDFGEPSRRALELAIELARIHEADLTLMHVCEVAAYTYDGMVSLPVDVVTPIEEAARRQLDELVSSTRQRCRCLRGVVKLGAAWEEILRVVRETQADLVVMGTHGRHGVTHALMGSVAEKLVRTSPVPVLTVRGG